MLATVELEDAIGVAVVDVAICAAAVTENVVLLAGVGVCDAIVAASVVSGTVAVTCTIVVVACAIDGAIVVVADVVDASTIRAPVLVEASGVAMGEAGDGQSP